MIRRVPIKRKTPLKRSRKKMDKGLIAYYEFGLSISTWCCEECKKRIPHSEQWQWFSAQAHILPKDKFKSVAAQVLNRLHLCPDCHTDWDSSWQKAQTMKVFNVAIERLKQFTHQVKEKLPPCIEQCISS
jgi:uncharacterized protein YlaI